MYNGLENTKIGALNNVIMIFNLISFKILWM